MAELNVLLADDDAGRLRSMAQLVHALRPRWNLITWHDIPTLPDAIATSLPDLCILNARVVETIGNETMRELHAGHPVIYITTDVSYAVQAFDLAAIDFIVEPVRAPRLEQALKKAEAARARQVNAPLYVARSKGSTMLRMLRGADLTIVRLDDVRYFQAESKYTRVVLQNTEGHLRMGLSAIEPYVNPDRFWRINRGYVINAKFVQVAKRDAMGRLCVLMQDRPESLPVARPYESLFRDGFS